jgi:hypothetical protein
VSGSFLSELRYQGIGYRLGQERFERGEFRSLAAHRRSLTQLVTKG